MNLFVNAVPGGGQFYAATLISIMLDIERCKRTPNFGQPCPLTGNMHKAGAMMSHMYVLLPEYRIATGAYEQTYKVDDLRVDGIDYFWKCMEWFKRGPAFQDHTMCGGHMTNIEMVDILHEYEEELPEFKYLAIGVDSLIEAHAAAVVTHFKQIRSLKVARLEHAEYCVEYKNSYGRLPESWGEAFMPRAHAYLDTFAPIKETKIGNTEITSVNYLDFLDKPIETITEFLGMTPTQEQLDLMQSIVQNYNDTQDLHIDRMLETPWQDELDAIKL